eukprot:TRINITY_DN28116_c0_g1_i1.p1 TRINITY_DN28116_c0_g1~~TRINITY_DN28116_c0_g1_i1.p1  ORF type:complete len:779 (-),score=139.50 TRINITY_DN28116_c0_g1_i1:56-2308(-)
MATGPDDTAQHIVMVFKCFDTDGDGRIGRKDMAGVLQSIDPGYWSEDKLDEVLREADLNADGKLQYEELVKWIFKKGDHQRAFGNAVDQLAQLVKEDVRRVVINEALRELKAAAKDKEERVTLRSSLKALLEFLEHIISYAGPGETECPSLRRTSTGTNFVVAAEKVMSSNAFPVRGCSELLTAAGFREDGDKLVLAQDNAHVSLVVEELQAFLEQNGDADVLLLRDTSGRVLGREGSAKCNAGEDDFICVSDLSRTPAVAEGEVFYCVQELPLFKSTVSEDVTRYLREGTEVVAAGPPEEVDGYMMLPIKPTGAVELGFLWRIEPEGELASEPPPEWELYGSMQNDDSVKKLVDLLTLLPGMDKKTMSGACSSQTFAMEDFMERELTMHSLPGECFVQGVKAFELRSGLADMPADKELCYTGIRSGPHTFKMSVKEVLEWQSSFRTYYAADVYVGDEGKELLQASLQGKSDAGKEAWMMKFAIRCSKNPVIMKFDGQVLGREIGDETSGMVYLISVCGIDFASRVHDHLDLTTYITNWRDVYKFDDNSIPIVMGGRDFMLTGVPAVLDVKKLLYDLKKMARLRLRAQDALGIEVVVEVGLGLGVFAGDGLGIGKRVRTMSALAIRQVLEEETFEHIKLVVLSLPIFRLRDNFHYFSAVFSKHPDRYAGRIPVLLMDQDMHAIATAAAAAGFKAGELNPADSHGIFGEYWQNLGPGTEEKLALTTCGLLTQHHAVNPGVLDKRNYIAMEC